MPILQNMFASRWQSERIRLKLSLAALLLVIAQLAAVAHFIGHSAQGSSDDCTICATAAQSTPSIAPSAPAIAAFYALASTLVDAVRVQVVQTVIRAYRSRAPPF